MDPSDAQYELHGAVIDFCESAEQVDGVDSSHLIGDGNLGGCNIYFNEDHEFDSLKIWGGHQFSMDRVRNVDEIDASDLDEDAQAVAPRERDVNRYGPIELDVQINGQIKQVSTFGWGDSAQGEWRTSGMAKNADQVESSLEWAENPEPGLLKIREDHVDEGETISIDIR